MESDRRRIKTNKQKKKEEKKMKKVLIIIVLLLTVACGKPATSDNPLLNELLTSDQLIIAISPDYPPYEDYDNQGNIIGFDVDMMNELILIINEENGVDIKITWKDMAFDTIVGALQTQQIDLGVSGFTYDPERNVFFSKPYLVSKQVVVVNSDSGITKVADLNGKKVGAQTGTTGETVANDIEGATVVSLSDANQIFAQLQTNAIDALVIDKPVADNFVSSNNAVILNETLLDEETSIIVHPDNTNLQKAIDSAITKFLSTDTYQQLLKKWEIAQ